MNNPIKASVLCYTDETDNTKGTLAVILDGKETRTEEMAKKFNEVIEESGIIDIYEDPMAVIEIGRQIAFLGSATFGDYSFYFEECEFIQ